MNAHRGRNGLGIGFHDRQKGQENESPPLLVAFQSRIHPSPGVPVSNIGPNPFVLLFDGSIHGGIKHGVSVRGICRRFIMYTYSHGPPHKQAGASSPCKTKFARLPRFIMDPTG